MEIRVPKSFNTKKAMVLGFNAKNIPFMCLLDKA